MDKKINRTFYEKNKSKIYTTTILISTILLMYAYAFSSIGVETVLEKNVIIATVHKDDFQEFIAIDGKVVPSKTIFLDAVAGGQVLEIYVEDGDILKKGDPILKLNNTSLLLDVMTREAQLFEQENFLRNSLLSYEQSRLAIIEKMNQISFDIVRTKRNYQRDNALFAKKMISDYELETSRDNYQFQVSLEKITRESMTQDSIFRVQHLAHLQNSVDRLRENYLIVKQTLDRLVVTAPMDGQITAFNIEIGQSVAQQDRIAQIDLVDDYKIEAFVDEHYLTKIAKGLSAIAYIENQNSEFVVSKIYPTIENNKIKLDMEFKDQSIKVLTRGQRLQMKLELGESVKSLLLKRGAFFTSTGGNWVFAKSQNENVFTKKAIRISKQNPMFFVIEDGLKEGDQVIVSGYDNIKSFTEIELIK